MKQAQQLFPTVNLVGSIPAEFGTIGSDLDAGPNLMISRRHQSLDFTMG